MRKCNLLKDHSQDGSHQFQSSPMPATDDAHYIGENSSPFKAFKGLVLADTSGYGHYKIEATDGILVATLLDGVVRDAEADFNLTPATVDGNARLYWDSAVKLALWQDLILDIFDTNHWTKEDPLLGDGSGTLTEAGGAWALVSGGAAGVTKTVGVTSDLTFGDIDVAIDCNDFVRTTDHYFYFFMYIDATHYAGIVRYLVGGTDRIRKFSSAGWGNLLATAATTFKLRITRSGDNWEVFYDIGAGWVSLQAWIEAIGTPAKIFILNQVVNAASYGVDIEDVTITGSSIYWEDSPECYVTDGGAGEWCLDATVGKTWTISAFKATQSEPDTSTVKFKAGWGDAADRASATWLDAGAWHTEAELLAHCVAGDLDGHRYIFLTTQFNSDSTDKPTLTKVEFFGGAA